MAFRRSHLRPHCPRLPPQDWSSFSKPMGKRSAAMINIKLAKEREALAQTKKNPCATMAAMMARMMAMPSTMDLEEGADQDT